jgi:hypothetical protein
LPVPVLKSKQPCSFRFCVGVTLGVDVERERIKPSFKQLVCQGTTPSVS